MEKELEKLLLDASKATIIKQGYELSEENYNRILHQGLKSIIINSKYDYFTNRDNYRSKLKKYTPRDYFCLVRDSLIERGKGHLIPLLINEDGSVNFSHLDQCIFVYSRYISNHLDNEYYDEDEDKTIVIDGMLDNIKFYSPSTPCREAIMSGKQTQLKKSGFKGAGMMAYSDVGKVRENQEDSYYIGVHPKYPNIKLMLVADGMGGHRFGEVASNMAAREMIKWFENLTLDRLNDFDYLAMLAQSEVGMISDKINAHCYGGGTTLCFSIIKDDSIFMGNVGDSRGFVTKDGHLEYATRPDSLPFVLGVPEPFDKFHSRNNRIVNCLGGNDDPELHCKTIIMDRDAEYRVALCSDGVSDCLVNDKVVDIMKNSDDVARDLVTTALDSNLSFKEELIKEKKKAGIFGRHDYTLLLDALENEYGMSLDKDKIIYGGKDNTTAVYSGEIRRGR